jgi:hypothetical protein
MSAERRHRRPVMRFALAVAIASAMLAPGAVRAQSLPPGVHLDPGSPAGHEYQIPIPSARSETAGGTPGRPGAGGSSPPLFGVGITPAAAGSSSPRSGSASSGGSGKAANAGGGGSRPSHTAAAGAAAPGGGGDPPSPGAASAPTAPRVLRSAVSHAGGSSWVALVIGGVLVLVLGGGGGLALGRRSRPRPSRVRPPTGAARSRGNGS